MRHLLNRYGRLLDDYDSVLTYFLLGAVADLSAAAGFKGSDLSTCLRGAPVEGKTAELRLTELRRWTFAPTPIQAILRQAMEIMHKNTAEAVCIYEHSPT